MAQGPAEQPGKAEEQFARRFAERVIAAPWRVILTTLLLVAVASSGIARLEFSANYRVFFDEDNPQLLGLEALENTYGKNENIAFLIVPDDGDATSQDALSAAIWLTEAAWQTPYSRRVDSLANFQHTTADGDDLYVRNLVDPQELARPEARSRVRAIALSDPRIAGAILSRNGDVSVVNVTIELPEEGQLDAVAEVAEFSRSIAGEAEERFPGIDLRTVGTVMINQTFIEASIDSQKVFLPASLLLMAVILGVLTRGWPGVLATGLVIVFSILASMGLGGWAGLPLSPPIAPAPTIVLMIVVANCVHLLVAIQQRLRAGEARHDAIVEAIRLNLSPVFLASLTTALGFLSMNFSEVPPYRHLGIFVAFGITASFLLSVTFLPALLSLLPIRAAKDRRFRGPSMRALADTALRHRKALLLGWVVIVPAMMLAIPRNELNDVLVHFFDESVEFRQDTDFMDEHLSGNTLLEYSLHASDEGGVTDPRFLAEVSNFAGWYREQPPVRHVAVITDTFRQLNQSMHGDDPAAYRIPESQELAAQYLLLYELSLPQGLDLNNQIDRSRSATRVSVSAETLDSENLLELNARAEAWLDENAPHIGEVNSTGPRDDRTDETATAIMRLFGEMDAQDSALRAIVGPKLMLEYDIGSAGDGENPLPGMFVRPGERPIIGASGQESDVAAVVDALVSCVGWERNEAERRHVERVYLAQPEDTRLDSFGVFPSRPRSIRLAIMGFKTRQELRAYLEDTGWPGQIEGVESVISRFRERANIVRSGANLDVQEGGVGPTLGLTLIVKQRYTKDSRYWLDGLTDWDPFLTALGHEDLVVAEKLTALADWVSRPTTLFAKSGRYVLLRGIHHIKLVISGDRLRQAKAYVFLVLSGAVPD